MVVSGAYDLEAYDDLHPDLRYEAAIAQQRHHRRTAQMLLFSQRRKEEEDRAKQRLLQRRSERFEAKQNAFQRGPLRESAKVKSACDFVATHDVILQLRPDSSWIRRSRGSQDDSAEVTTEDSAQAPDSAPYVKEEIPWACGTVRKQTSELEMRIHGGTSVTDGDSCTGSLSDSCGQSQRNSCSASTSKGSSRAPSCGESDVSDQEEAAPPGKKYG